MKLTEKSSEIFTYVKENGGRVAVEELMAVTGRNSQSVGANINDLAKKGLVVREKVEVEGDEDGKTVTYVVMTDEGRDFTPSEDAE